MVVVDLKVGSARRAPTLRTPPPWGGGWVAPPRAVGAGPFLPPGAAARPALLAVALADVIFAVDSVPAILAITTDTFVVFAANAFALLGLRALFFLVAGAVARFAYLQLALGVLLIGIAGKLVYAEATGDKLATSVTLGGIAVVLTTAIGASLLKERRAPTTQPR